MSKNLTLDEPINVSLENLPTNKEDFQLIWLDVHINSAADAIRTQTYLRMINSQVQFYIDETKCLEFIENVQDKHIIVIVSDVFANRLLARIVQFRSIRSIFIFCAAHDLYAHLDNDYSSRITGIYHDRNNLIKAIIETMRFTKKHDMIFRTVDQQHDLTSDLSESSASFLWHNLLVNVLRKLSADELAKNEMLDHCVTYYRDNPIELNKIHHFRTSYTPDQVIKYYINHSFLHNILDKALHTENIQLLYIFRYIIIHLCDEFEKEKGKLADCEPLTLFRAEQISTKELESFRNSIGSFRMIKGFMSTTRFEDTAIGLTKLFNVHEGMVKVFFVIKADPQLQTVMFADVKDEGVVLFSFRSVFQVEKCYYDEIQSIWRIVLLATDQASQLTQTFLPCQNEQLQFYSPLIWFGRLVLMALKQIDIAEEYFNDLLNTLPSDHADISDVYNQIGAIHYIKASLILYDEMQVIENGTMRYIDGSVEREKEQQTALDFFQKAFEMRKSTFSNQDIQLANSLNNIGSIYNDWKKYDQALEYYHQALNIFDNLKVDNNIFKGNLLQNIALLNERQGHFRIAFDYYLKVAEVFSQCLPIQHPQCAQISKKIANFYENINELNFALQYYQQAYESCESMLLPSTDEFRTLWEQIVGLSLELNLNDQANTYLDRVSNLCKKVFPSDHSTLCSYINFLATHFEDKLDFDKAYQYYSRCAQEIKCSTKPLSYSKMELYEVSDNFSRKTQEERISIVKFKIETYEKLLPRDDVNYAFFLRQMANFFKQCQVTDLACHYLQIGFDIIKESVSSNGFELISCCQSLVDIHFENNDESSALHCFEQVEKFFQNHLDCYRIWINFVCHMAQLYKNKQDIDKTLLFYDKAVTAAEMVKSDSEIRELLQQIFKICFDNDREQTVASYIHRAIRLCEQDSIELSRCCLQIGDLYFKENKKDDAFIYYERFLLATETNDTKIGQYLDRIWIEFVIRMGNDQSYFDFVLLRSVFNLFACVKICHALNGSHYKQAIALWQLAKVNEKMGFYNRAFDHYTEFMLTWEEVIYVRNDTRALAALTYMWQLNDQNNDWFLKFLNFGTFKSRWGVATDGIDEYTWQCILQQMKLFKMAYSRDIWKFHIKFLVTMQNQLLSTYVFNKMLQVCQDELSATENRMLLDETSILCCLEYVSHWYFLNEEFDQSLLYRQYQLNLECKKYTSDHVCVGWSLWFIGLILNKKHQYKLSLEHLTKAWKIFENNATNQKNDIQMLNWHIFEINRNIIDEDLLDICTNDREKYTLPTT